jgi:uncharacterized protein YaiE (UPF0345 family)
VTADDKSRLYGAADPSFTDTITGFANGENSGVVSGSATNTTPGTDIATSAAGSTYAITPTLGSLTASNYDFTTFNAGTLTVNKAHLTVTADDKSRLYGAADPSFTDTITGFANGENSGVVSGSATNTTPGTDIATSAAGSTYAITPTLGSLTASNYDFTTFNAGTLTVNPRMPTGGNSHFTVTANDIPDTVIVVMTQGNDSLAPSFGATFLSLEPPMCLTIPADNKKVTHSSWFPLNC